MRIVHWFNRIFRRAELIQSFMSWNIRADVYIAPWGNDSSPGSRKHPKQTLAAGLDAIIEHYEKRIEEAADLKSKTCD